ncbi:MAG TPA: YkvA family protein [Pyrinomonadaceae bacterium]
MRKNKKSKTEDLNPKSEKLQLKSRMKNLLMFLPNLAALCFRLLKDGRVPLAEKALFVAAIIYFISPLDFIPDVLPFIGQIDDLYLIALTLVRLVSRTDERILREHWTGGGDIIQLVDAVIALAPRFLPRRVNRVLTAKVEMAKAGEIIDAVQKRDRPIIREIPQRELEP